MLPDTRRSPRHLSPLRAEFGGMKADDVKRLKQLETENAQLKRIVVDKELEIDALREIAKGS